MPRFVCIADTVAKLRARQLGRNRHIVAWSAKLLSPNTEIVSRLNWVILADRRLKCVLYKWTGCEKSKSALGIGTGSSFSRHFGEKPKIGVFLSPVLTLPLATHGRYWRPSFSFWTARRHVLRRNREMPRGAKRSREATSCRGTARLYSVQRNRRVQFQAFEEVLEYLTEKANVKTVGRTMISMMMLNQRQKR